MVKEEFLNFTMESWRFCKLFDQLVSKLPVDEQKRYLGRVEWYRKQLSRVMDIIGYKFVDLSGEQYNQGMAATPLNITEFTAEAILIIDYMIEPIIVDKNGNLVKTGTAMLRSEDECSNL